MIKVTAEDILYSESILLKPGQTFDHERLSYIKNFETLDLQAVPGSGKTTALLAKLLILEKHLPLEKDRGVLVLSHTNAAINEIKDRIGQHCPKLFSHPNFVGTIQSFTDIFLAIPAYGIKYKQKPIRIDNEIYNETISRIFGYNKFGFVKQEKSNAIYYNKNFNVLFSYRFKFKKGVLQLVKSISGDALEIKTPNKRKEKFTSVELDRIAEWLYVTKLKVLEAGILCYDDAYLLADIILSEIPSYISLLQKRFKFVFVDEMQDMEKHQFDLLERVFIGANSISFYQRLGDVNQSIYSKALDSNLIWSQRSKKLFISGSHRLSKPIAKIVERFALTGCTVQGRMKDLKGNEIAIKPIIFSYNLDTITDVIPKFAEHIQNLIAEGSIVHNEKNKYEAVGWRKHNEDNAKICISDYWPNFSSSEKTKNIDYIVLKDYLQFCEKNNATLAPVRKSLLNGLCKILYIEGVRDEFSRVYTITKLIRYFKTYDNKEYEALKLNLYNWCVALKNEELDTTLSEIIAYIPQFLHCFGRQINKSTQFINGSSDIENVDEIEEYEHSYSNNGIDVKIGSVHSVKGQTHTATLYLETFFSKGAGNYESERLREQIKGLPIKEHLEGYKGGSVDKIVQSARMAYVGFSRPTHLLCLAIENSRLEKFANEIDKNDWDVIQIKKTEAEDS
ncbi:UvrD-helicase domain-containing protein [Aquimarina agarilytica]|uniref:UvrD-helicase domain-containing protein n=1 Tax=Aquimarina agarilytica TaxID=1087449 RepID=UPI0002888997|nr:UvrD-helicase domain-containing protein [Aquimarina agarilytica]